MEGGTLHNETLEKKGLSYSTENISAYTVQHTNLTLRNGPKKKVISTLFSDGEAVRPESTRNIIPILYWETVEGGRDLEKKSVDWSDTDTLLNGESIGKAIVLLQIPEVLSDEVIQVLLCNKLESAKRL